MFMVELDARRASDVERTWVSKQPFQVLVHKQHITSASHHPATYLHTLLAADEVYGDMCRGIQTHLEPYGRYRGR